MSVIDPTAAQIRFSPERELPPVGPDGLRLQTPLGAGRHRIARRAVVRPLLTASALIAVAVVVGIWQPVSDSAVPVLLEELHAALPLGLAGWDVLQVLLLPFIAIALVVLALGALHARRTRQAVLTVAADGRLVQRDGRSEHVDLDHLLEVDVVENHAFTDLNEQVPIGSPFLLRLVDAAGCEVLVNPGMWRDEAEVTALVRRYAEDGNAAITPEAAARYGLPCRSRHGHLAAPAEGPALRGERPCDDEEREARLRALGIDIVRGDEPAAP